MTLHGEPDFFNDHFWRDIAVGKRKENLAFRAVCQGYLFSLPNDFMVLKRDCHGNRLDLLPNDKLRVEMGCDLYLCQRLFPLFINLVLKDELDVGRVGLHRVYKQ